MKNLKFDLGAISFRQVTKTRHGVTSTVYTKEFMDRKALSAKLQAELFKLGFRWSQLIGDKVMVTHSRYILANGESKTLSHIDDSVNGDKSAEFFNSSSYEEFDPRTFNAVDFKKGGGV